MSYDRTVTPITSEINDLFRKWGVDPDLHRELVHDLMRFVYEQMAETATKLR